MVKPIGILGGTFDPVHHGHLRLAMEILELVNLAEVRLIPLHKPPHRHQPLASSQQRLAMLRLAVENVARLLVDDREIVRGGISYTVDTLKSLREENADASLCLIMGMDAFRSLNTWHEWKTILDYAHIILADRQDITNVTEQKEIADFYSRHISRDESVLQKTHGTIMKLDIPVLDISASRIRTLCSRKKDPRFLLPDCVLNYIKQEALYS